MTTVTTRLAIDVLRSARVRREAYVGEWLPEPLVEPEAPARRRGRGVRVAGDARAARAPEPGRARGLRPARVLRRRLRRDRRDRRPLSRTTAARSSRARAAGSPTSSPRFDADPASAARWPRASSPPPARATSRASSPCSRRTRCSSATAAASPARSRARCVGAAAIARALVAFYGQVDALGVTLEPVWVNGQPGFRTLDAEGRSSTSSGSTSSTAASPRSTRSSTRTSSPTSARRRRSGCGL